MRVKTIMAILSATCLVWAGARAGVDDAADFRAGDARADEARAANPFSALVGERRDRRRETSGAGVERYVLASDDRAFLFVDNKETARVKFLCADDDPRLECRLDPAAPAPEIYLLDPVRGPRGDVIYKNAEGDALLRIASYGGATVFWPGAPDGAAASKSFGEADALRLTPHGRRTAERRAASATAIISALTGAPIVFEISGAPRPPTAVAELAADAETDAVMAGLTAFSARSPPAPALRAESSVVDDATVLADAIVRAAIAVEGVADDPTGARILASRIERVVFLEGPRPALNLEGRRLSVTYVPNRDVAGRPSSRAIERFLEDRL